MEDRLEETHAVRLRQDTGISSPRLYPTPLLPLVLSATAAVGQSAHARESSVAVVGSRAIECKGDMLANFMMKCSPPRWVVD